jgi:hypothetical protein
LVFALSQRFLCAKSVIAENQSKMLRLFNYSAQKGINTMEKFMTYEEYLDEVTTLLTEMYNINDEAAIKYVMRAQAADYFSPHDDHEEMRTLDRAMKDAKIVYETRNKSRPEIYRK